MEIPQETLAKPHDVERKTDVERLASAQPCLMDVVDFMAGSALAQRQQKESIAYGEL